MYGKTIWGSLDITKTRLFKYMENFTSKKTENFQLKNSDIFHISAQSKDCVYSLEPPRRGGSNEYPQSMFYAVIRKIMYTPVNPSFTIYFTSKKTENFQLKNSDIFHISAQSIDCVYSLEPPRRGGSNEYPQSMFYAVIRKIMYTPVNPSFTI